MIRKHMPSSIFIATRGDLLEQRPSDIVERKRRRKVARHVQPRPHDPPNMFDLEPTALIFPRDRIRPAIHLVAVILIPALMTIRLERRHELAVTPIDIRDHEPAAVMTNIA